MAAGDDPLGAGDDAPRRRGMQPPRTKQGRLVCLMVSVTCGSAAWPAGAPLGRRRAARRARHRYRHRRAGRWCLSSRLRSLPTPSGTSRPHAMVRRESMAHSESCCCSGRDQLAAAPGGGPGREFWHGRTGMLMGSIGPTCSSSSRRSGSKMSAAASKRSLPLGQEPLRSPNGGRFGCPRAKSVMQPAPLGSKVFTVINLVTGVAVISRSCPGWRGARCGMSGSPGRHPPRGPGDGRGFRDHCGQTLISR
jgi:hypothetical protein